MSGDDTPHADPPPAPTGDDAVAGSEGPGLLIVGRTHTLDPARPTAGWVLVRGGRIRAVGAPGDDPPTGDHGTVELEPGHVLLPACTDAHAHLTNHGRFLGLLDLRDCDSPGQAGHRAGRAAKGAEPGTWILGRGWDPGRFPGRMQPTRMELDDWTPDHPVALWSHDGHSLWCNSAALRLAGITEATDAPAGGTIERTPTGEPTGVLRENAVALVQRVIPEPGPAERADHARLASRHAFAAGVTCMHTMEEREGWEGATRAAADAEDGGDPVVRVLHAVHAGWWRQAVADGVRTGDGDDLFRTGGIKLYLDGALGSRTAWMLEPYRNVDDRGGPGDAPDAGTGLETFDRAEAEALAGEGARAGLGLAIHAIGDAAVRRALDLVAISREVDPVLPCRVEHAQHVHPDDIARFGELRAAASVQPAHLFADHPIIAEALPDRVERAYPLRTLLDAGAPVTFGSDVPIETGRPNLWWHAAVTRRDPGGRPRAGLVPGSAVTRMEAVVASCTTAGTLEGTLAGAPMGAVAGGPPRGVIAPGAPADLAWWDGDPLDPDTDLTGLAVRGTWLAGRRVHAAV